MKPISIIAAVAHKGGVGKSFTTRVLYQALARVLEMNGETRRILVVDVDPGGNTGGRWLPMEHETQGKLRGALPPIHPELNERSDVSDIWMHQTAPVPYPTAHPKIDVVPPRENNLYALTEGNGHQFHVRGIHEWLNHPDVRDEYCAVFIDTPPNKGSMTQAALTAATHCFVPVAYEQYPVEGMDAMLHLIEAETLDRPSDYPLNFLGLVANMVPSNRSTQADTFRALIRESKRYGPHLIEAELRSLRAYSETDAKSTIPGDLFDYPSKSHAHVLREVQAFCKAMFSRMDQFKEWQLDFRKGPSFEILDTQNRG